MLSQVVSYPAWTLPRVAKQNSKERLTRDRWDKGRLEVHILLGLFTNEHIKTFHVRSEGRVDLPFLFPDKARSGNDHTLAPSMILAQWSMALSYFVLAVSAFASSLPTGRTKRVCWSSSRSRELSSLVMALPAGFSLWATPNRRLVVIANQANRNVSDLVLPSCYCQCGSAGLEG